MSFSFCNSLFRGVLTNLLDFRKYHQLHDPKRALDNLFKVFWLGKCNLPLTNLYSVYSSITVKWPLILSLFVCSWKVLHHWAKSVYLFFEQIWFFMISFVLYCRIISVEQWLMWIWNAHWRFWEQITFSTLSTAEICSIFGYVCEAIKLLLPQ